jgi:hypothetical protein
MSSYPFAVTISASKRLGGSANDLRGRFFPEYLSFTSLRRYEIFRTGQVRNRFFGLLSPEGELSRRTLGSRVGAKLGINSPDHVCAGGVIRAYRANHTVLH